MPDYAVIRPEGHMAPPHSLPMASQCGFVGGRLCDYVRCIFARYRTDVVTPGFASGFAPRGMFGNIVGKEHKGDV